MELKKNLRPFLRYLAVFSVPVVCMATLLLYNNVRSGHGAIQQEALGQMAEAGAQLDWLSAKMEATALHMAGNERLTGLSASGFDAASYTATRTFGLLRSYERNLPQPVGMLFFLRGGKNIYANQKFSGYPEFILSEDYEPELGQADLYLNLNSVAAKRVVGIDNEAHDTQYCAAVYYPVPEIAENPSCTVCFLVPRTYAEGVLEQYFPGLEARAFVMDAAGNVLYNGAGELYGTEEMTQLLRKNPQPGVMSLTAGGQKYILLRGRSGNTGLEYLVLVPRGLFYQRSQGDLGALAMLVAVLLIFSTLMALSLANSAYQTLRRAQQQKEEIAVELDSRNSLIREMVLYRLLRGTIANDDDTTLEYNLTCAGLRFEYDEFVVALCLSSDLKATEESFACLAARLERCELPQGEVYPVLLPANNGLAAIWNCPDGEGAQAVLAGAVSAAIRELGLERFQVGCGLPHHGPYRIDNSYVEALVAISEKQNRQPSGCYLYAARGEGGDEKHYQYPYVEQALIEQSIRNGNAEIAVHSVERVLDKIERMEQSLIIQKCLHFDIINLVVKIAASLGQPLSGVEVTQLSSWENSRSLRADLAAVLTRLAERESSTAQQKQTSTKFALLRYVQQHYRDPDLTLDKFAAEFGLSYSYISRVFKEETGQSFLSYVTQLRFGYVKQQLAETARPIKDVIADAGYYDLTNFLRKFKHIEGVTPGQYRAEHQQS